MVRRMRGEELRRRAMRPVATKRPATSPSVAPLQLHSPEAVLTLQRLAGNRAVVQQLKKQEEYDRTRVPTRGHFALEVTKPTAVIGSGVGTGLGTGDMGIGSGIIGGASLLDAGLTLAGGYGRFGGAKQRGDKAGMSLGRGKMRTGTWGAMGSSTSTTQAGVNVGKAVGRHGLSTLGTVGGALGVVGGGLTSLQGMWRMYKAAGKLSKLGGRNMYTPEGDRWKDRVSNREKWKLGVGGLKVALGALGIAAGALLIASNPVGWAVGIAAAVAGGAWALSKIGGKLKDLWERRQAKKEIQRRDPDGAKRKEAKQLADDVAKECSTNAKVAGEMVGALDEGDATVVPRRLDQLRRMQFSGRREYAQDVDLAKPTTEDKRAHDSFSLLGVLNISPDEAQSESGKERIEKKLSVAESA